MLGLSKKLLFAIEAVVDIAHHGGHEAIRSSEISDRQCIPRRYLEQVLQQLVREGILAGQRGPKGGYKLARERRKITVGEIVRVVRELEGGGDPVTECDGSDIGIKVVRPLWVELQDEVMARLDGLTIDDLCRRAREQNVGIKAQTPPPDFVI